MEGKKGEVNPMSFARNFRSSVAPKGGTGNSISKLNFSFDIIS